MFPGLGSKYTKITAEPRPQTHLAYCVEPRERVLVAANVVLFLFKQNLTRNSSGDEIANVNFLYDDIVHAVKIQ